MENLRKHHTQMSPAELDRLREELNELGYIKINSHAEYRCAQKGLFKDELLRAVKDGTIIEAHGNEPRDVRILVRGKPDKRGICACVVVSVFEAAIVTAYPNFKTDNHRTLDWQNYNWDVDLVETLNTLYRLRWQAIRRLINKGGENEWQTKTTGGRKHRKPQQKLDGSQPLSSHNGHGKPDTLKART